MSSESRWKNDKIMTIWRAGKPDKYGAFTYSEPEHVLCTYRVGGSNSYTDKMGVEFIPKSLYWTELLDENGTVFFSSPNFGDKVLLGKHLSMQPDAADIKSITIDDALSFSDAPDYVLGV